jgi:hypothetical protein
VPIPSFVLVLLIAATMSSSSSSVLLRDQFDRPNGLITNEYAYWNSSKPAVRSTVWRVSSGSLFARNGHAWTGAPDDRRPNSDSSTGTGSTVFRATTRRDDLQNVMVAFKLFNAGLRPSVRAPTANWNGVHLLLRHQSEFALYAVSVNRRDNRVAIKKKVPGGPSNDGTYYTLAAGTYAVPYGRWQSVTARTINTSEGFVTITLDVNGRRLLQTTDLGRRGGAPITAPGRIGIRGDNCEFMLDDLVVTKVR